MTKGCIACVEI